ncbi:sigma-70 family RNA polymerase sigma factor [Flammeovirgaceae bacterium 311]|nr:sigma-70 family RNA polymerase sigma factor [Flammeovirgaceae bacterium 311]
MIEDLYAENVKRDLYTKIETVYEEFREEFVTWMRKTYVCSEEEAVEIYQVSVVILYENILSGKLQELNSSIKTYLFAIGKNKFLERSRHNLKFIHDWNFNQEEDTAEAADHHDQREQNIDTVMACLDRLGDKCKEILQLYYYQNLSMEEIALSQKYKNAATVKNLKFKCLSRLRKMFKENTGLKP